MAVSTRNVLSVCTGIGGLDLGYKLVSRDSRTVCYVEREATAARMLAARFQDGSLDDAPIWSDLKTFNGKPWRGLVDTLIAGYPCQPFSVAGRRRGKKDERHLWPEIARLIREIEPEEIVLENVAGHLRVGFYEVAKELRTLGYDVAAGLFTAQETGYPHRRQRLFALAHRAGRGCRELRQSPGKLRLIDGRSAPVADACGGLISQPGRRTQSGNGTRSAGPFLVHAECRNGRPGCAGSEHGPCTGACQSAAGSSQILENAARPQRPRSQRQSSGRRRGVCQTSDAMAHARGQRSQIERNGKHQKTKRAAFTRGGFIIPPGPSDHAAWSEVLKLWPEIEPAFCGSADGPAHGLDEHETPRVDALRALGNGVHPLTAALALCTLRDLYN